MAQVNFGTSRCRPLGAAPGVGGRAQLGLPDSLPPKKAPKALPIQPAATGERMMHPGLGQKQLRLASPELGVLLIEISALPGCPVPNLEDLDDNVIPLPAPLPQLQGSGAVKTWGQGYRARNAGGAFWGLAHLLPIWTLQRAGSWARSTTSPDWFSLSLWPRLSCRKSIPASLFRVPLPTR